MAKKADQETEKLRNTLDRVDSHFLPNLGASYERITKCQADLRSLLTFANGLYDEIDKLSKKAPAEPLTDLALQQVNDAIREAKALGSEKNTLRRVKEFVAAGDNPQQRDAVITLRLVRAGLEELQEHLGQQSEELRTQLDDARALKSAIEARLDGTATEELTDEFFSYYGLSPSQFWQSESNVAEYQFNFDRLDEIDLDSHFSLARS